MSLELSRAPVSMAGNSPRNTAPLLPYPSPHITYRSIPLSFVPSFEIISGVCRVRLKGTNYSEKGDSYFLFMSLGSVKLALLS